MTAALPPTREAILAHGLPAGFIERQRRQAHLAQAHALGAFLVSAWRLIARAGTFRPQLEKKAA